MKKALIFQGGWDGHEPQLTSRRFARLLAEEGYETEITDSLDTLDDLEKLMGLDLIVACWTMGEIDHKYVENISKAVAGGVGLAGCHGGMCDSFRQDTEWQFMTGGGAGGFPRVQRALLSAYRPFDRGAGDDALPAGALLPYFQ